MNATPKEVRLTMIGVFLGLFLAALDQTIVSTALPRIVGELKGAEYYAWVTTSYLLTSTVFSVIFGRLTELFSRKAVLLWAVVLFLLGSALSGQARNMPELILFRGLQGVGGGALFALALTTIAVFFPPRERGRLAGAFGAIFGLSSAVGPWLGGLLTDHLSWRWVFYINMPVGAVALWFILRYMPRLSPERREPFDFLGAFLLVLWTVPLMLAFSFGGSTYPWGSPEVLGLFLLAFLALGLWIWAERRTPHPLFDLSVFALPTFRLSSVAAFFYGPAFLGAVAFLPLYLQVVKGVSASQSGVTVLPLTLGVVLGSVGGGQVLARTGRYKPLLLGSTLFLLGLFLALHFLLQVGTPLWAAVLLFFLLGLGLGPAQSALNVVAQTDLPPSRIGSGTSMVQFVRQIGSTMGIALLGTVLASHLSQSFAQAFPQRASVGRPAQVGEGMALDLKGEFARLEALYLRALEGDEEARKALLADPFLPEEAKKALPEGGLPGQFRALEALAQRALAGDEGAKAALLRSPFLPPQLKALLQEGKGPLFLKALEELQAEALAQAKARVQGELRAQAAKVEEALKEGVTGALKAIFLYAAFFILLALLPILLLPDRLLQGAMAPKGA